MAGGKERLTDSLSIAGKTLAIRAPQAGDEAAMARFAAAASAHDLLFLARDIRQPKVLAAWLAAQTSGEIQSFIALDGDEVAAMVAAHSDRLGWSAHVWDIRLLVGADWRGKGLGRVLLDRAIGAASAAGAMRLTARMTPDQTAAITLFEESGFRAEALLRGQLRDAEGRSHDLALLAMDLETQSARRAAFGD